MNSMIILGNTKAMELLKAENAYGDAARLLLALDIAQLPTSTKDHIKSSMEDEDLAHEHDPDLDGLTYLEMIADVHGERNHADMERRIALYGRAR